MRKILYSPGYGAGWTTWMSDDLALFALEYQPIIDFLESGGEMKTREGHNLIEQFEKEVEEKFPDAHCYTGGADQLRVAHVEGQVRVDEYDGSESVIERGDDRGWL